MGDTGRSSAVASGLILLLALGGCNGSESEVTPSPSSVATPSFSYHYDAFQKTSCDEIALVERIFEAGFESSHVPNHSSQMTLREDFGPHRTSCTFRIGHVPAVEPSDRDDFVLHATYIIRVHDDPEWLESELGAWMGSPDALRGPTVELEQSHPWDEAHYAHRRDRPHELTFHYFVVHENAFVMYQLRAYPAELPDDDTELVATLHDINVATLHDIFEHLPPAD